jgi:hypothetical protein
MKYIILLLLFTIISSCSTPTSRTLASEASNDFRIAVREFSATEKLAILGVEANKDAFGFDATDLGFSAFYGSVTNIDPKFLIAYNSKGIQRVYTFEYGNSSRRRLKQALESEEGERRFYLKLKNKDNKATFPKLFLDVPDVKLRKASLSYLKVGMKALAYTPFSYINSTYKKIFELIENKKTFQGSYLSRIIEMAVVEKKFPELIKLFGEEAILNLGASIRLRYETENKPYSTIGVVNKNKLELYRDYIYLKNEIHSENMSKLVERANEEGLIVMPVAHDFAFLFYDLSERIDPELYDHKHLGQKNIDKLYKKFSHLASEQTNLLPLGVFTLSERVSPTEGIDFNRPSRNINLEKTLNVIKYALDVGMDFVPIQYVSTAVSIATGTAEFIVKKRGRKVFKTRIYSEAQMTALYESATIKLATTEIMTQALVEQLKELNIDGALIKNYQRRLGKDQPDELKSKTMNEIYLLFSEYQTGKRKLSNLDGQYRFINKFIAWNRLKSFTDNDKLMSIYHEWLIERQDENLIRSRYPDLDNRERKRQRRQERKWKKRLKKAQRKPNATTNLSVNTAANRPAIIFLVGGLTPEKIKRANEKGLIPNIKKYFIDQGVQFDTYATQPLSLPTIASLLTGEAIDEHGLRSDTPISRYDERPEENYVDIRKEYIVPKYLKKSRSYHHIEQSGAKWFLSEIANKKLMHINYLPVYAGGATPVAAYMSEAVKKMDRGLYGVFAQSVIMDKASSLQARSAMVRNQGYYKLIANWYGCVDVFSKLSNKALYQCIKELDLNIGSLLETAAQDPTLKFSDLYLISDAGHVGGEYEFNKSTKFLNNTGLNLTKLFAGDYNSHPHYVFAVSTFESPDPDYDLKFLKEYLVQPFRYTYRGKNKKRKGNASVMVDYFGDGQARVYLKNSKNGWKKRNTLWEMNNFTAENNPDRPINIIDDLLKFKLKNTAIVDSKLRKYIKNKTKLRPVKWISFEIFDEQEISQVKLLTNTFNPKMTITAVLSLDAGQALILSRKDENQQLVTKFISIKNFKITKDKVVSFERSNVDPFNINKLYPKIVGEWITERAGLKLLKNYKYPTLLSHFGRLFRLNTNLQKITNREGELADIVMYANDGFNFNSSYKSEADKGHLDRVSTKISFFHGSFNPQTLEQEYVQNLYNNNQLFERDIAPFILYRSNPSFVNTYWKTDWNTLLPLFDEFYLKRP